MDGVKSIVRTPQNGASLEEYLQGFADEEMVHTLYNQDSLIEFCKILHETFREFENIDHLQVLKNIMPRVNDVDYLLFCIQRLEPVIGQILELLDSEEVRLKRISKLCTIGRILGSSLYIVGTVGHVWMRSFNPEYSKLCFGAAIVFGLFGFVSTASEISILRDSLDQLMAMIRRDQELMAPIQRWFQNTNELEGTMKGIFSSDVVDRLAGDFDNMRDRQVTPVTLLAASLRSLAQEDFARVTDVKLIRNFINFTQCPEYQEWIEWVIFRRYPVIVDVTENSSASILQLRHRPTQLVLCQSIPLLAVGERYLRYFSPWGRIIWNLVSIVDAGHSLRRSEMSTGVIEIEQLRHHLHSELASFQRIADFIRLRRLNRDLELS